MKVTVKIDDRYFEVEIANLHARPVVATVEGETFEVWPAGGFRGQPARIPGAAPVPASAPATPAPAAQTAAAPASPAMRDVRAIHAPIPGVIVAIEVAEGDTVEVGQPVCVLEAMKMKNVIRAPRVGQIARIAVAVGDHVQHHDLLVAYAD